MKDIDMSFIRDLTLEEKASLVTGKDFWFTANVDRKSIPSVMVTDGPSGLRKQSGGADALGLNESVVAVSFPSSALTASSLNSDLVYKLGTQLGIAAQAEDIGVLLGPGINIKRSPLAGRNFEYFSEDPFVAGKLGVAYVDGVQNQGVGVSVKHFAANNRENQRFTSSSNVDERTLREIYLSAFEKIVKEANPATIMCSYNKINGKLVSQNQLLLTDMLRNEWGYQGLVMSDWGAVADLTESLKAGLDLEMPGNGQLSIDKIVSDVKSGKLEESRLDIAVLRVLHLVKNWHNKNNNVNYNKDDQHEFARQLAADSIVLMKNEEEILPLQKNDTIALIGDLAENPRYQGGGSAHVNAYNLQTPLNVAKNSGLKSSYAQGYSLDDESIDSKLFEKAVELARQVDKVVFFAGFPENMETEGFDKTTIDLPANQIFLLEGVAKVNANIIVVLQNGSVVSMPWIKSAKAIVETYLAGEAVGEATWDILTGKVNPSGKLTETFPIRIEDNPTYGTFNVSKTDENYHEGIFVGYRHYDLKKIAVAFPFGHGLSYTTFLYDNLVLQEENETIKVELDLRNTGKVAGAEAIQVYVSNQVSLVEKPIKELKEFKKIYLQAQESTHVVFQLNRRDFSWFNMDKGKWQMDNGSYSIQIGSSSRDIRMEKKINVTIGTDSKNSITPDTYFSELIQNDSSEVKKALEKSGFDEAIKSVLNSGDAQAILENIPLRAMGMVGMSEEQINKFLSLVN